ncbi:protoporphyrinogen oxidase [Enemella dayhoffiae]|uniref:Coproporphyrinogen III oxidase n=1 Tax=Enemella dayhoffiae TaxID=2016507 RepID=A0A255GM68_9ACTN|nr:protoporphyrinogen oxidase [Enemella dayhoffiae]OYO16661.1 protoporphyrinogen oxidase [Enemella dayhoffiae]
MKRVVVIGAGLAGLVAARRLVEQGHQVQLLEASDRVGGQVHTVDFHRLPVDVGAESMHLGAPQLAALVDGLGLTGEVVGANPGSSWLHTRRGLTHLPAGVGPTGPTRLGPVLKSGLLSPFALARAGLEPLLARKIDGDLSVGEFTTRRFGRAVTETFVDPLLGNLHAGDVDRLSLVSTAPQLLPVARAGKSLVLRKRPAPPPGAAQVPMFASFPDGLRRLIDGLADGLSVRLGAPARALGRTPQGWRVDTDTETLEADEVLLAMPAAVAADLLAPHFADTASVLTEGRVADVATIVLAYPAAVATNRTLAGGNGILLNSRSGRLVKAATFLSRKWGHLESDEVFLVRASAGRAGSDVLELLDDDGLARRVHKELSELVGISARPVDQLVTRWNGAYPQLEVGHAARMLRVREQLAGSGVRLVGSAFDGLGMPSVVKSAEAAVAAVGER